MRLLQYKDLDLKRVKPAFAKVRAAIEADDFKSPDVKKLHTGGYYCLGLWDTCPARSTQRRGATT